MPSKSLSGSAGSSNTHSKSLGGNSNSGIEPFELPAVNSGSGVILSSPAQQTVTIGGNGSASVGTTGSVAPALDNPLAAGQNIGAATGGLPFTSTTTPANINIATLPLGGNATSNVDPATGGLNLGSNATTGPTAQTPLTGTIVGQSADGQTLFVQQTAGGPILPVAIGGGATATPGVPATPVAPTMNTSAGQMTFPLNQGSVTVSDMIRTGTIDNAAAEFGPFASFMPDDAVLTTQFSGTSNGDSIKGTRGDDQIDGNAGNDRIEGRFGNDVITGGAGNDRVRGDEGDDRIAGGPGADDINGNEGDDLIFGEAGNDILNGDRDDDIVDGGDGDDQIQGESGNDAVLGGNGDDRLFGGLGDDLVAGGPGDDLLEGGSGDDVLHGGAGNDTILTGSGMNIADGSDGADSITAEEGSNILFGGFDDDEIEAQEGAAILLGGEGNDVLMGGMAATVLAGGEGDDIMNAGMGDGIHIGGGGADVFTIGSDVIGNGMVDRVFALDFNFDEDTLVLAPEVLDSVTSVENTSVDIQPQIQAFIDAGLNSDQAFDRMSLVESSSDFQDDLLFLLDTPADSNGEIRGDGVLLSNDEGDQFFLLNIWAEELGLQTTDDADTV